jgi:uncharacterized membrane protein
MLVLSPLPGIRIAPGCPKDVQTLFSFLNEPTLGVAIFVFQKVGNFAAMFYTLPILKVLQVINLFP